MYHKFIKLGNSNTGFLRNDDFKYVVSIVVTLERKFKIIYASTNAPIIFTKFAATLLNAVASNKLKSAVNKLFNDVIWLFKFITLTFTYPLNEFLYKLL